MDLLNYRRNGDIFYNRLLIRPLKDASGVTQFFLGIQTPIREDEVTYVGDKLEESMAAFAAEAAAAQASGDDCSEPQAVDAIRQGQLQEKHCVQEMINIGGHVTASAENPLFLKVRAKVLQEDDAGDDSDEESVWIGFNSPPGRPTDATFLGVMKKPSTAEEETVTNSMDLLPRIGRAFVACFDLEPGEDNYAHAGELPPGAMPAAAADDDE